MMSESAYGAHLELSAKARKKLASLVSEHQLLGHQIVNLSIRQRRLEEQVGLLLGTCLRCGRKKTVNTIKCDHR